jgi:transposase-like protein
MPFEKDLWTEGPGVVVGDQSMGKIRRRFDVQFKTQVCEHIRGGLETVAGVCQEYQISRSTVERWLAAFDEGRLTERSSSRERQLERENERLKAKVGELTMQIDVLKKIEDWKRRQRSVASSIITGKNLARFQRPAKRPASPSRRTTTKGKGTR